ncbi:hypothetical protein R6Q59_013175 [Mikania micrantha]
MVVLQHEHSLILIDLNPKYPHDEEVYDDEEDLIIKQAFQCPCNLCYQEIIFLHRYYYKCDQCDYLVHKLCGELPTKWDHASHSAHTLTLLLDKSQKLCNICKKVPHHNQLRYKCSICMFNICLDCCMEGVQYHAIYHPSHQHPLIPLYRKFSGECDACGRIEEGVFYHCATCFRFFIHSDCVFRVKRLLIQDSTCGCFFHAHPLILTYSFPTVDQEARFDPLCRVCDDSFSNKENLWMYKCEKCRYYIHMHCGYIKCIDSDTPSKNYEEDPNILHLPLRDETYKIINEFFFKEGNKETTIIHKSHPHPLTLVDAGRNDITSMRPISSRTTKYICNGCTRPIMDTVPFYMCTSAYDDFMLHECCTRLPVKLQGHRHFPEHTVLLSRKRRYKNDLDLFFCIDCGEISNGFAYHCDECNLDFDIFCALKCRAKHSSHPHLLSRVRSGPTTKDYCRMCLIRFSDEETSLTCELCAFHIHPECGLLFPKTIRHKYDKHPMTLTYGPVENHGGDYFCEVCEEELNPNAFFYHCQECHQSIHLGCAPLDPQHKAYIKALCWEDVSLKYRNVKFGGFKELRMGHQYSKFDASYGKAHRNSKFKDYKEIGNSPRHSHFRFLYGTESDGPCSFCGSPLKDCMILKCQLCEDVVHSDHMTYIYFYYKGCLFSVS